MSATLVGGVAGPRISKAVLQAATNFAESGSPAAKLAGSVAKAGPAFKILTGGEGQETSRRIVDRKK